MRDSEKTMLKEFKFTLILEWEWDLVMGLWIKSIIMCIISDRKINQISIESKLSKIFLDLYIYIFYHIRNIEKCI